MHLVEKNVEYVLTLFNIKYRPLLKFNIQYVCTQNIFYKLFFTKIKRHSSFNAAKDITKKTKIG